MTNDLRDAVAHALWRSEGAVLGVENLRTVNAFLELPSGTLAAWRSQAAAAISAMRGARVKPLEWKLTSTGFEAKTLAGTYEVYASLMTDHWLWRGENGIALDQYEGKGADPDDAKAAAQADYERRILSALTPTTPSDHPDDLAVDRFAAAMKAKLAKKRADGRGGWETPDCSAAFLSNLLREHVEKGDPLDVGNFAMMLHQRGDAIQPTAPSEQNTDAGNCRSGTAARDTTSAREQTGALPQATSEEGSIGGGRCAPAAPPAGAVEALADYEQADMDGIMVLVSRQAIEACLPALRAIAGEGE